MKLRIIPFFYASGAFPLIATSKRNIQFKQMFAVLSGKIKHVLEFMPRKFGEIKNDYLYSF